MRKTEIIYNMKNADEAVRAVRVLSADRTLKNNGLMREYDLEEFSFETQKKVSMLMWDFIRDNIDLCDKISEIHDDNLCGHEIIDLIKGEFALRLYHELGVVITWSNRCMLCAYFDSCEECPLQSCCSDGYCDNPYGIVCRYAEGDDEIKKYEMERAIDDIKDAIRSVVEFGYYDMDIYCADDTGERL